jgi:hypothetical protein
MMNDGTDFLSTARNLMTEAQSFGAEFHPDGTWTVTAGQAPLPATLSDRLRVHRGAIAALFAEGPKSVGDRSNENAFPTTLQKPKN